jgi:hypothetical protein
VSHRKLETISYLRNPPKSGPLKARTSLSSSSPLFFTARESEREGLFFLVLVLSFYPLNQMSELRGFSVRSPDGSTARPPHRSTSDRSSGRAREATVRHLLDAFDTVRQTGDKSSWKLVVDIIGASPDLMEMPRMVSCLLDVVPRPASLLPDAYFAVEKRFRLRSLSILVLEWLLALPVFQWKVAAGLATEWVAVDLFSVTRGDDDECMKNGTRDEEVRGAQVLLEFLANPAPEVSRDSSALEAIRERIMDRMRATPSFLPRLLQAIDQPGLSPRFARRLLCVLGTGSPVRQKVLLEHSVLDHIQEQEARDEGETCHAGYLALRDAAGPRVTNAATKPTGADMVQVKSDICGTPRDFVPQPPSHFIEAMKPGALEFVDEFYGQIAEEHVRDRIVAMVGGSSYLRAALSDVFYSSQGPAHPPDFFKYFPRKYLKPGDLSSPKKGVSLPYLFVHLIAEFTSSGRNSHETGRAIVPLFGVLNSALRGDSSPWRRISRVMIRGLGMLPACEGLRVYRGTELQPHSIRAEETLLAATFEWRSFVSTSLKQSVAKDFCCHGGPTFSEFAEDKFFSGTLWELELLPGCGRDISWAS